MRRSLVVVAAAFVLVGAGAQAGPCSTQIAQLEKQIGPSAAGAANGPSAPQSLGAQLHHQPTPEDVGHAEHVARKDADAALEAARKADAAGNASACDAALTEAKRLYDIDQ